MVDILTVIASIFISLSSHFEVLFPLEELKEIFPFVIIFMVATPIVFHLFGLYNHLLRHSNATFFLEVIKSVTVAIIITIILTYTVINSSVRLEVIIISWSFLVIGTFSTRRLAKWAREASKDTRIQEKNHIAIFGTGKAGIAVFDALDTRPESKVVAFFDDDPRFFGRYINGIKIYNPSQIETIVEKLQITQVIVAIAAISHAQKKKILLRLGGLSVLTRVLPSINELIEGKVTLNQIRDVNASDLLWRKPHTPDLNLISEDIKNKNIMVTGGGGSIGSELCRQAIVNGASSITIVEHSEFSLYSIEKDLIKLRVSQNSNTIITPILGDVTDEAFMARTISKNCINTLFHAAAFKHVPMVEANICIGVKNNTLGTLATALAAINSDVEKFVLISTDKAVRPTNVMGASKRLSEMVLQALNQTASKGSKIKFTMVRFGNVLDSAGSVVPLFRDQIKRGGPITLTHKEVTRFFMTIPEAAQLVLQAGAMAKGGDVFLLDMGKPIKIYDLATRMIKLSGLKLKSDDIPDGDIEIDITGMRPGEKLFEELFIGNNIKATKHPSIMRAEENFLEWEKLSAQLNEINLAISTDNEKKVIEKLQILVEGYHVAKH